MIKWAVLVWVMLLSAPALAIESYDFSTAEAERRFYQMARELRCPTCQNQSISDSDAPLAADLRRELHRMLEADKTDAEILDFMVSRYGDFVHYRPRLSSETYLLWFGPFVLLGIGFVVVLLVARNKRKIRTQSATVPPAASAVKGDSLLAPSAELTEEERARLQSLLQQEDKS